MQRTRRRHHQYYYSPNDKQKVTQVPKAVKKPMVWTIAGPNEIDNIEEKLESAHQVTATNLCEST